MKKIILMMLMCFTLTGCSLIPRLNFGTPGTVPQAIDKSKTKAVCKGITKFNDVGDIIYCSKGFYLYEEGYQKVERKMTVIERIKGFINNLMGFGFWGLVLLVILVPSLAGTVVGRIIEATIGITGKALRATIKGIQKSRKTGKDLNDALSAEEDSDVKKYIAKLKEKENIK